MIISYFLAYYVIPKFLLKKKYVMTVVLFLIGTYLLAAFNRVLVVHVGETLIRKGVFTQEPILEILTDWKKLLFKYIPNMYLTTLVFLSVKYFLDYKRVKEKELVFEKEKTEAELKTLKAQLNPHFLFNTLNNIYSLSLSNSPKTPASIGKLSEMLDYVLYRCNTKLVLLSNEIKLIENYIELEKLRYDSRLKVSLINKVEKDIKIPPLILLSLVENAFKHGAGEDSGSPEIKIEFLSSENSFKFKISNTVSKDYVLKKESIGLSNVRKQLDLIYQDQYSLTIENEENKFKVVLKVYSN
ncbi:histidine kinase [Tenacibaculum singaporense]|uniref:Histidine kinase n=1 Tax=Tenacibaculum singaporense TaxID=2358479 RepID=A0A451EMI1_9FLAO|nr:histidine kinase [Tenacibaculum singaporense]